MESKISNLRQNFNLFEGVNKKPDIERQKNFKDTIKSYDKDQNTKSDFQTKYKKAMQNKENNLINNDNNPKDKKQVKDFENQVKDEKEKDVDINYKDKYNLFLSLFQNISELKEEGKLDLKKGDINISNLQSLFKINPDKIDKFIFDEEDIDEEDILDKTSKLISNQENNEETLEKDLVSKLTIDKSNVNKEENRESVEDKIDFKEIKTDKNLNLNSDDDQNQISEDEKVQLLSTNELSEEDTDNLKKDNESKEFKLEQSDKFSKNKIGENFNVNDKVDFTLEKQEINFTEIDNMETKDNEPIDKKQFMNHILEKVKFDLGNNKNQIKVTLKPESLGEMIMEVEVIKNNLVAKIMVDNHKAKEMIENNLFQFKEGVKDTGLEIKTFEVFVGNNSDFNKHNSNGFNFNERNKKMKIKGGNQDKKIEFYEENIKIDEISPINIYSGTSLNLFA